MLHCLKIKINTQSFINNNMNKLQNLHWNNKNSDKYCKTSGKSIRKQVRTNIGLADTLIPSSFIYLFYMGGTGHCDSIKIIFGYHVNS